MRRWICIVLFLLSFLPLLASASGQALVLEITGPIGPATQDYIERGIAYAADEHFSLVILQLDTPGGLDTSMRGINKAIISSTVPVVAYVTPAGARATSAGAYIMYAAHVNAMAPGTNMGAATPIHLMTSGATIGKLSIEDKKALNDAAAYMRSLAQLRDRNVDWADQSVRNSRSISAEEALREHVIDVMADNVPQLLEKINGREVVIKGANQTVNTSQLSLVNRPPDWRYQFLQFMTNPNIAYLLMLMAIYGILFELYNPGLVLPGVAGVIAALLFLYAFQLIPISYTGFSLVLLGIAFMILELYVSTMGILGVGGVVAFMIGSILLFDVHDANYDIAWPLIWLMSLLTIAFFFMIVTLAIRSQRKNIVTGQEGLRGETGTVISAVNGDVVVQILGEIWNAKSNDALLPGQKIRIIRVEGLVLIVEGI